MTPSKTLIAASLAVGLGLGSLAGAGEPVTQLTFQGGTAPAWSPDGTQIAFTSQRSGQRQIWVLPAAGEPATPLTAFARGAWDAAWSPDGTAIAFTSDLSPLVGNDLWVIPATGGDAAQISHHDDDDSAAAWSADGTEILFHTNRGVEPGTEIWVMPAAGEPPVAPLVTEGDENTYADCSRDGSQIAFASSRNGTLDIWVMPRSGGPETQLTFDEFATMPSWSPDGTFVAFSGSGGIWVALAARGKSTQITFDSSDFNPAWSPDGTRIAFTSSRSGTANIWVVALETAGIGTVTAPPATLKLAVSPNPFSEATAIRFSEMAGIASLRVIDIAGRVVRELGLPTGGSTGGERTVVWDGRDGRGRAVPRGVYYFMLEGGNRRVSERVIRLR
jgi:Tol biopolymer transport system component